MPTGSRLLLSLDEVDVAALDAAQRETLASLQTLNPATLRRRAMRFERWFEGEVIRPPSTPEAFRSLMAALRTGCELNSLHPDREISLSCKELIDVGMEIEIPMEYITDDFGSTCYLVPCALRKQQSRRKRLSELPPDWLELVFAAIRRSSRELQLGIIVLALTGCRPCEVSSMRHVSDASGLKISIRNAKSSRGQPDKPPRFREFRFLRTGEMSHWVTEFERLAAVDPQPFPLAKVSATALANLCQRIPADEIQKVRPGLTPSCFRNVFAADLKCSGFPREEIAYYMGHESMATASRYGVARQGRKGRRDCLLHGRHDTSRETEPHPPRPARG